MPNIVLITNQPTDGRIVAGNNNTFQEAWMPNGTITGTDLTTGVVASGSDSTYPLSSCTQVGLFVVNSGNGEYKFFWVRVRTMPPNDIMPSASFGTVAPIPTTLSVNAYTTNSSGMAQNTLISSGTTNGITGSKSEVLTYFSSSAGTVPASGYLEVTVTASSAVTIYWGTGQLTNFATPATYNYVLAVNNTTSTSWSISLGTMASMTTTLGRLANLTIWFTSPFSDQVIVLNGALSQSSGSAVTLPAGPNTTVDIAVAAVANAMATSSNSPSMVVLSLKILSATGVYAMYTISVSVT